MKKGLLAVVLAAICTMGLTGCDRVEPGYVGIKVNKLGEDKGIGEVVGVGRQWTGLNTELYTFPTFKQMKTYDEPFTFQMSDGTASLNTMIVRRMAHININKYLPTRRNHMKILVRISASTDYDVYPLFMVKSDGLNDEEIQSAIERNLVEYTGMDADSVYVDDDGVCWHNGSCWYVDDTMPVSDEDAAHLERILGISTFE